MIENNIQKTEINNNINLPGISKEAEGFLCRIAAPALIAGSEFLAVKFRAATLGTVCEFANKYASQLGVDIKPTPPKFLLPFIEKASLEDDDELKKKWAKLLVAAGNEYNPIHIQYSEILSQIGSDEAKLLKKIYDHQNKHGNKRDTLFDIKMIIDNYNSECTVANAADYISGRIKVGDFIDMGEGEYKITSQPEIHIDYGLPDEPNYNSLFPLYECVIPPQVIILLKRLELIEVIAGSESGYSALTVFGYDFVKTLEDS